MERQMKKLEQDVAGNDGKPICKIAECAGRDSKNQVNKHTLSRRLCRSRVYNNKSQ